ncbi:MAG: response regulator [Thermoproteota archaeon]|nr:response regulator [Thermoproteota archaeon]
MKPITVVIDRTMSGVSNNRILLVDDEPDLTAIFSMGLEDNGLKVNTFNDPQLALSEFKEGAYDLVILDYKMPNLNGFELYREIRKVDEKVRVCFLTAFDIHSEDLKIPLQSISTEQDAMKHFIQKPIELDDLVKRIKEELIS